MVLILRDESEIASHQVPPSGAVLGFRSPGKSVAVDCGAAASAVAEVVVAGGAVDDGGAEVSWSADVSR